MPTADAEVREAVDGSGAIDIYRPELVGGGGISAAEMAALRVATLPKIQEVASTLSPLFGRELLAIMTGVRNPRTVTQWIRGETDPHPGTAAVLRNVAQIATFLLESGEQPETVQAWFIGMNPQLKGKAPAEIVGEDPRAALKAAKAFVQYP